MDEAATSAIHGVVIAIDGPAGSGKSTVARILAKRLEFLLLDSGALYRALALHLDRLAVDPDVPVVPESALESLDLRAETAAEGVRLFLAREEVTDLIRGERIGSIASRFSTKPEVRATLLTVQREIASKGGVIAEGRDMGTVVFPHAQLKFFLRAEPEERARRRYRELVERGQPAELPTVEAEMRVRDLRDSTRKESPLVQAPDAISIDTTHLTPEEVIQAIWRHVCQELPFACLNETR
ncbi:MAG: (d)CMP kinase [Deltaproteobacteria bacterium]|nr:(d)CMP kinase [Deltaproteobacteria bacterium]